MEPTAYNRQGRKVKVFIPTNDQDHTPDVETLRILNACKIAAKAGTVPDNLNALFTFSNTATEILVAIANGTLDARTIAKKELALRGAGTDGTWIGFKKAADIHKVNI